MSHAASGLADRRSGLCRLRSSRLVLDSLAPPQGVAQSCTAVVIVAERSLDPWYRRGGLSRWDDWVFGACFSRPIARKRSDVSCGSAC